MLRKLTLTNFRNHAHLDLNFDNTPTVFVGRNGAGKSNILEAVYLLSTTKSQRVDSEAEFIREGEEFCSVVGVLEEDQLEIVMQMLEGKLAKRVKINGINRRGVDFIGNLPAVIFYPSDINMVTGAPSLRRWHLDIGLAQIDPEYKRSLSLYEQFLTSRNRVLKRIREGLSQKDELDYWTEGLLKEGKVISDKRQAFFDFINNIKTPLGKFTFPYHPSLVSSEKLTETNSREVAAAATLIGPHRDDFSFFLQERNMTHFGSRGEQRTATLAFKLALLEYMANTLGKRPILLLDDVFSELDGEHRAHVVEVVAMQQTIIATVELENIPQEFLDSARILTVEEGKIL
jgi:DNA replication and repair protein RecF